MALLGACSVSSDEPAKRFLGPSGGDQGEVLVVMDSNKWVGPIGEQLRSIMSAPIPGTPQGEPYFSLRYVDARLFDGLLRKHRNLLLVSTTDSRTKGDRSLVKLYDKQSLTQLQQKEAFYLPMTEVFAKDQDVLNLIGKSDEALLEQIRANRSRIRSFFDEKEEDRIIAKFRGSLAPPEMQDRVKEKFEIDLLLQKGYLKVEDQPSFLWLRDIDANVDRNLIITYKNYTSEEQFSPDSLVAWRNEIGRSYLYSPDEPEHYVYTEDKVPVTFERTTVNGLFAVHMRGLWRIKDRFVGGPFIAYAIADAQRGRMYYLEGFVLAPGEKKREPLREMRAMIKSFRPVSAE